jgi:hypothetical protein
MRSADKEALKPWRTGKKLAPFFSQARDFRCALSSSVEKSDFHGTLGALNQAVTRDFRCDHTGLWVRFLIYSCRSDRRIL